MSEETVRTATGLKVLQQAINRAQAFANLYGEEYSVFFYADVVEYDVQPASPTDSKLNGRVYRAVPFVPPEE